MGRKLAISVIPIIAFACPVHSKQPEIADHGIAGFPNNAHYCQIIVLQHGTLGASYDASNLGSREAGGVSGRVEVTATNSSFRLTMENPKNFELTPPGYFGDVRFNASMSGRGNTNFGDTSAGSLVKVKKGNTLISANMSATKLDGSFPAGSYRVGTTLRCE